MRCHNDDKAVAVSASSQITGIVESLSYKNTIKTASKIIPDAKKIVAILDDTVTGMGERIQYYKYKIFIRNMSLMKLMHQN